MVSSPIFQKTALGRAEVAQRSGCVPMAARSVLIMVNGRDTVAVLAARGLPRVHEHLQILLAQGLIEPVEPVPAVAAPAPVPPPEPAIEPTLLATQVPAEPLPWPGGDALYRRVLERLTPHFGPDAAPLAQPLRQARTLADGQAVLDHIETRLAVYLGRRQAARELQALRPLP